jgi:2',3'-cyclic-nucleotide 2'-phosphodiesterase/3'-nucleotidase
VKDFWDLMPFDNYTVTFDVSGADLKKIIDHGIDSADFGNGQFSGLVVTYDPAAPFESKVVSMTLADGTPIDPAKMYKVGTNDFQFGGGDKYVIKPYAKNVKETFEPVREALLQIAKAAGSIQAPAYNVLIKK